MLEVRLIGRFDIKYDGKPVTISSRAAQSLFTYLILTAGVAHRREKLAGMFWPDASEEKARAYLRYELWRIRKSLATLSEVDYLISDDINISFDSSVEYWLDVAQLRNAGEGASVDDLINALSDIQGELLPGFYDEWITEEREHFQVLYEQRIRRLLEMLEKEQRWNDIPKWAESWISFGHAPEAPYRALMVAYDALGDRAKVMATYDRCVQALRELDLEPSEEIRALIIKGMHRLNIPVPLTSFIGREQELTEVASLLSKSRLVTLTGSGGVGKTRLAIQVVADVLERFPDGVWFLDLAPVTDVALVPTALANLLKLRESGELPVSELLTNYFGSRTVLIIFDNCEHLIDACAQLIHLLLTYCEYLSVLATSREALHVAGETSYRVPSLEIPRVELQLGIETLANIESVKLFVERASAISSGFKIDPQNALVTAQICQRLDGIPLAIELAAARTNTLSAQQILSRLDDRFNLLTRGLRTSLPRHQTLRESIEWSYNLLSEKERLLFQRLAVFVGGWTLEAAEEVCSGNGMEASEVLDLLSQLVDKSLLLVENMGDEPRYRRLETIRQFAREKLFESGEATQFHDRQLEYFLRIAESAEPRLRRKEQAEWLKRLDAEHDNLRSALAWAMKKPTAELALRLAGSLGTFWDMRAHWSEGANWLDQALSKPWDEYSQKEKAAHARGLYRRSQLASGIDDLVVMKICAESALELCKQVADLWGIAFSKYLLLMHQMRFRLVEETLRTSLEESADEFRRLGDTGYESGALDGLALLLLESGDREEFLDVIKRAIGCARNSEDRQRIAYSLTVLAMGLIDDGEWDEAEKVLQEAGQYYGEIDSFEGIQLVSHLHVNISFVRGNLNQTKAEVKQVIEYSLRTGEKNIQAHNLTVLAVIAELENDLQSAGVYAQKALELEKNMGVTARLAFGLSLIGLIKWQQGEVEVATQYARDSLEFMKKGGIDNRYLIDTFVILAGLFIQNKRQVTVQILALTESLAKSSAIPRNPILNKPYFDRFFSLARPKLSESEFASAWDAGSKMGVEEAIAYVLRELQ